MKIMPNNVKLTQIRNKCPIKPNRWKHTKDKQLSTEQLSNGYTKASGMKENNDSSWTKKLTKTKKECSNLAEKLKTW